ncbi:MAG: F0F1 ATP synthase subunit B family protein [Acidobacteriaceae bacterium]
MSDLLQQLGGLVFGAVPTMLLFLVTLAAYRLLVHTPLTKVLRERYARTQGAIEKAAAAVAAAEKKTADYEERLRLARVEIFRELHDRLDKVHEESELALAQARAVAQERTATARIAIEDSMQVARQELDGLIGELSSEILARILPAGVAQSQKQASQEQAG